MKIAFLNIYNGVLDRGAETFVKEMAVRLSRHHKVIVFQGGEPGSNEPYKIVQIPVKWDWTNKSAAGTIRARFFLDYWSRQVAYFTCKSLSKIVKERFDVVIPMNGGWQSALVRLATWFYGGRVVISGQAGIGWDDINNLWCFPNVFVAVSSHAKNWAKKVNPFVKVSYVPNGVDTNKFQPIGPKFKTFLKHPIVLCVGALTPAKRMDLVIKSVGKFKEISLLIVGDGDLRDEIKTLGEKLLKKRFQLKKIPFEKMPEVYRATDIFTIASMPFHSFEIVLVEAMATNLPVVANNDPIRREIVGEAGVFVDPKDTSAYAKAIKRALDKNWENIPKNQAKKFDWNDIAEKYNKLFLDS